MNLLLLEQEREKYERLDSNCHRQGWKAMCLPVEVARKDFAGQSLCRFRGVVVVQRYKQDRSQQDCGLECGGEMSSTVEQGFFLEI